MKIVKGIFVLAFAVTLFSSCMEEDYVKPSNKVEDAQSEGRENPGIKPGQS